MFGRLKSEALERLAYRSRACVDTASPQLVSEILGVSLHNNARDGITGALAVNDGWFLQVVEGPPRALEGLLDRLSADTRHTEIEILSRRAVSGRLFCGWSMVATPVTPDLDAPLMLLIDDCRRYPEAAIDALMRMVASRTATVKSARV